MLLALPDSMKASVELITFSDATDFGKEWIVVSHQIIAQCHLCTVCSVLRLVSCKDVCFQKVNPRVSQRA